MNGARVVLSAFTVVFLSCDSAQAQFLDNLDGPPGGEVIVQCPPIGRS